MDSSCKSTAGNSEAKNKAPSGATPTVLRTRRPMKKEIIVSETQSVNLLQLLRDEIRCDEAREWRAKLKQNLDARRACKNSPPAWAVEPSLARGWAEKPDRYGTPRVHAWWDCPACHKNHLGSLSTDETIKLLVDSVEQRLKRRIKTAFDRLVPKWRILKAIAGSLEYDLPIEILELEQYADRRSMFSRIAAILVRAFLESESEDDRECREYRLSEEIELEVDELNERLARLRE